jgi:predicted MFS family arabinose efflux permease
VLGIGQGVLFYDAAFVVLTKRFDAAARRRAITAVTVAGGLASTIFAPLTAALNDHLGWRRTVWVLAALVLVVVVPAASFACRALPRTDASFHWDQLDAASGPVPRQIVRSRQFILLAVAYVLAALTTYAIPVHLVAYLHSRGVSTTSGAFALGAVGIAQVLGRGSFVRVTRGASVVVVATGVFALRAVGIALLVVLPVWVGLVVFVLLYGWSNGVATLTRALTIAELYGPRDYGRLAGVIGAGSGFAGAIAPFLAAGAISLIGDDWVFGALALVALVASGCNELAARHVASHAVA